MTKTKIILDDLTDNEAWALAQMCKRMIWDDFRRLSADIVCLVLVRPMRRMRMQRGRADYARTPRRGNSRSAAR
jgi:hypothetical protein